MIYQLQRVEQLHTTGYVYPVAKIMYALSFCLRDRQILWTDICLTPSALLMETLQSILPRCSDAASAPGIPGLPRRTVRTGRINTSALHDITLYLYVQSFFS